MCPTFIVYFMYMEKFIYFKASLYMQSISIHSGTHCLLTISTLAKFLNVFFYYLMYFIIL